MIIILTGRDLILYILQNNLEDEPVFKDGRFLGFMTVEDAAAKFNVGPATICTWIYLGYLNSIVLNDTHYIPADATPIIFKDKMYKGKEVANDG